MKKIILTTLVVLNLGCAKEEIDYSERNPTIDPPMTAEQLDLGQFDEMENKSETLSDSEFELAFEQLKDAARLLYLNKSVKLFQQPLTSTKSAEQFSQSANDVLNIKPIYSFSDDDGAKLLLQSLYKVEVCNPQLSYPAGQRPFLTLLNTSGDTCPVIIGSRISSRIHIGKSSIYLTTKEGTLDISLRPHLVVDFKHNNSIAITLKSKETTTMQNFSEPNSGFRDYRFQSATGTIKLADGQSLPYEHQEKAIFSYIKNEADADSKFHIVHVGQMKTVINGKEIYLTVKSDDRKKFEDTKTGYRCSINKKVLDLHHCLILHSEFSHY